MFTSDKLLHLAAFCVLSLLYWLAYKSTHTFILSLVFLGMFGLCMEGLQHFVPSRDFSLIDLAADVAGIFLGGLLYKLAN